MSQLTSPLDDVARHVLREVRKRRQSRRQQLPQLKTDLSHRPPIGTVFYLCPDQNLPSGRVRTIYRHVDMLNAAGIPAFVLHERPGFSCTWFSHHTQVRSVPQVALTQRDVLVVPELYGPTLSLLPSWLRVVVFSQNAYGTFEGLSQGAARRGEPYRVLSGLAGVLTTSFDNLEYLRFAFPDLPVERVRCGVDAEQFHPAQERPGRRIAVMQRSRETAQVLHLLEAHGSLVGWEVVLVSGHTERETATMLRSCSIFLSLSERCGFPLAAAEAMACGCYVVGFTGLAGREFFLPAFSTPVDEGDVLAFARAADELLREFADGPSRIAEAGLAASAHVLTTYSLERQCREVVRYFTALLAGD